MNKIKRVSLIFKIIFQILFIAMPISLAVSWVYAPRELVFLMGFARLNPIPATYIRQNAILHTLSFSEKMSGFCLSMVPTAIYLFILYSLIKLFTWYQQGEIFSLNHVKLIRNIGFALLLGQLFEPVYQFLMGIVLTMHNPPGHRFAAITLDQTNIGILLTALLVILISWIMAEGCKLREEQQLTI